MKSTRLVPRLGVLPFCLAISLGVHADPWPQFRGPARDGQSLETGLWNSIQQQAPPLTWMTQGAGRGYASLSVVDGKIFTTGNDDTAQTVSAFAVEDGRRLWSQPISERKPKHSYEGSRSTPTVDGDRLYACVSDGSIVCLKTSDGQLVWRRDYDDWGGKMMSGWGFSESPLVDGPWVICTPGGSQGMLVALDKMTGQQVWASRLDDGVEDPKPLKDGAAYSSIVVSHGAGIKQYVQLVGKGVIGVRASDGKHLWRYSKVANTTANIPTVLVKDDYLFCSTGYNTGSALLQLEKGENDTCRIKEVYFLDSKTLQNKHGGMVMVGDYLYAGHGNGLGLPICLNWRKGEIAWGPERGVGERESSVIYADGHLLFRFQDGTLAVIQAKPDRMELVRKFMPAYQEKESWSYPVIADGRLYLREQDRILCYSLR